MWATVMATPSDGDRARKYSEIDVLNETLREGTYWDIFGASGIAEIYKKVQDAVTAAGADTRLYTNEYNVLQFANDPSGGARRRLRQLVSPPCRGDQ